MFLLYRRHTSCNLTLRISAKVVTSLLAAKTFDRERVGLAASIMLPSVCVFGAGATPARALLAAGARTIFYSAAITTTSVSSPPPFPPFFFFFYLSFSCSFHSPTPSPPISPAEVLVSPFHLAMVRVQSGANPNVASALIASVKSSGALGPWNGAWAFALKVCVCVCVCVCF